MTSFHRRQDATSRQPDHDLASARWAPAGKPTLIDDAGPATITFGTSAVCSYDVPSPGKLLADLL